MSDCKHEFVLIDVYIITDKKMDPNIKDKIIFSKKVGKIYTFACKFCLELKRKNFYFIGGGKDNDKSIKNN